MSYVLELPIIETERLTLRGWREDDFACIAETYADKDHVQYFGGAKERWEAWRYFASLIGHFHLRGYTFFAVEENASGEMIGWVGPWNPEGWPEPELGYIICKPYLGKGYAYEAAAAALSFIYQELKWPTAISQIDVHNEPSKKLASKLGASFESHAELFGKYKSEIWRHLPPEQFLEHAA